MRIKIKFLVKLKLYNPQKNAICTKSFNFRVHTYYTFNQLSIADTCVNHPVIFMTVCTL